jgi:hypothetical protein
VAPRLITAALAILGGAAIGAASVIAAADSTSIAALAGPSGWLIPAALSTSALAGLTLALAIRDARPIFLCIVLLGAAWLVGNPDSSGWHAATAIAGGGLLAVAELAYWSLDFRIAGKDQPTIHVRRAATIAALVAVSTALALVPELDLTSVPVAGLELTAAGLLGAAALIAVAASMAWRLRPSR